MAYSAPVSSTSTEIPWTPDADSVETTIFWDFGLQETDSFTRATKTTTHEGMRAWQVDVWPTTADSERASTASPSTTPSFPWYWDAAEWTKTRLPASTVTVTTAAPTPEPTSVTWTTISTPVTGIHTWTEDFLGHQTVFTATTLGRVITGVQPDGHPYSTFIPLQYHELPRGPIPTDQWLKILLPPILCIFTFFFTLCLGLVIVPYHWWRPWRRQRLHYPDENIGL